MQYSAKLQLLRRVYAASLYLATPLVFNSPSAVEILRKISTACRAHERYRRQTDGETDDRQTNDRQRDGRTRANSEREGEFTFAENECWTTERVPFCDFVQRVLTSDCSQKTNSLLANVNSRSRSLYVIARPSVCLSSVVCRLSVVCLSSVTFVRPTQAVQIFGNISAVLGTLAIH